MVIPGGSEHECTQIEAAMCRRVAVLGTRISGGVCYANQGRSGILGCGMPTIICERWSARRKSSRFYALHWVAAFPIV